MMERFKRFALFLFWAVCLSSIAFSANDPAALSQILCSAKNHSKLVAIAEIANSGNQNPVMHFIIASQLMANEESLRNTAMQALIKLAPIDKKTLKAMLFAASQKDFGIAEGARISLLFLPTIAENMLFALASEAKEPKETGIIIQLLLHHHQSLGKQILGEICEEILQWQDEEKCQRLVKALRYVAYDDKKFHAKLEEMYFTVPSIEKSVVLAMIKNSCVTRQTALQLLDGMSIKPAGSEEQNICLLGFCSFAASYKDYRDEDEEGNDDIAARTISSFLKSAAHHPNPNVPEQAAQLMNRLGRRQYRGQAVKLLCSGVKNSSRLPAISALRCLEPEDHKERQALIQIHATEADSMLRQQALLVLLSLTPLIPRAHLLLKAKLPEAHHKQEPLCLQ